MKKSELKSIIRECIEEILDYEHPKDLPVPHEKKLKKIKTDMTNRFPYDTSYEVGKQSKYRDMPEDDDNFERVR